MAHFSDMTPQKWAQVEMSQSIVAHSILDELRGGARPKSAFHTLHLVYGDLLLSGWVVPSDEQDDHIELTEEGQAYLRSMDR